MDLTEARRLAESTIASFPELDGWRFEWTRAKTVAGVCRFSSKTIGLSKPVTELNDVAVVRNTILHEVAHALAGREAGHGPAWKARAIAIGCDGQRCSTAAVRPQSTMALVCPACGRQTPRYRRGNPRTLYVCTPCVKENPTTPKVMFLLTLKKVA